MSRIASITQPTDQTAETHNAIVAVIRKETETFFASDYDGWAECWVKDEGLKQVAEAAGISINTARTHLARIFEKTGVNSQTALVRLLLSVG